MVSSEEEGELDSIAIPVVIGWVSVNSSLSNAPRPGMGSGNSHKTHCTAHKSRRIRLGREAKWGIGESASRPNQTPKLGLHKNRKAGSMTNPHPPRNQPKGERLHG